MNPKADGIPNAPQVRPGPNNPLAKRWIGSIRGYRDPLLQCNIQS